MYSIQKDGKSKALTKLKAGAGLYGVEQLVPQQFLRLELWKLEQIHARRGSGQSISDPSVLDAERRVQLLNRTTIQNYFINGGMIFFIETLISQVVSSVSYF